MDFEDGILIFFMPFVEAFSMFFCFSLIVFIISLGFSRFPIRSLISVWRIWMRFSSELLLVMVHFRLVDLDSWFCFSVFFFFEFGRSFFQEDGDGFECAGAREGARCIDCVLASCRCRRREVRILFRCLSNWIACFVLRKLPFFNEFEFEFGSRYGKEVCDAVVAKCLTGRPKTVEKAQAVFLLWIELEAVDAFLVLFFCVFGFFAI